MPLDQIALLSFTSTRTSEVFMVFWANFFTCVCESAGDGVSGVSSRAAMDGKNATMGASGNPTAAPAGRSRAPG
jgi:hypothetical protein